MSTLEPSGKIAKEIADNLGLIIKADKVLDGLKAKNTVFEWLDEAKKYAHTIPIPQLDQAREGAIIFDLVAESRHHPDKLFSKIANYAVEKILDSVPMPFVDLMIDNIKIKSKGARKSATFDIHVSKSTKPYLEFIKKIDGIPERTVKIVFEIKLEGDLNKIKFLSENGQKSFNLGKLVIDLEVSVVDIDLPIIEIQEPIKLGSKSFEIDLSRFHFSF